MIYRIDSFSDTTGNPITGENYDSTWIGMTLTEHPTVKDLNGMGEEGLYCHRISRILHKNWYLAVGDFIEYCNSANLNGILALSEAEYEEAVTKYKGHSYRDPFLREDESPYLIHSTTEYGWLQIQQDGMLKSWNRLQQERPEAAGSPIGALLNDPEEFSNYIMFSQGISGEIVVSSKLSGFINMDFNASYHTGARLYFDARLMARDGLLIRDGGHLKVKDTLPLDPYLIWAATWDTLGMNSPISTPTIYAETADSYFQSYCRENGIRF